MAGKRPACSGFCCYKLCTVVYELVFLIIGILLLGIGLWVTMTKASYEAINDIITVPALLSLIIGAIMIIVAIVAIVGALKEHLCILRFFLAFVIFAFIIQIVIGILAFVYRDEAVKVSSTQLRFALEGYTEDDSLRSAVDYVQTSFDCCGLNGPSDWDFNSNYSCGNRESSLSCSLPESCCMDPAPDCLGGDSVRRRITSSRLYLHGINTEGCSWDFLMWIESNLDVVGATAMGFAILHILGIFVVYMYITKVEDYKKLFRYRKRVYEE